MLIDNGKCEKNRWVKSRPLKSLSDILAGKQGRSDKIIVKEPWQLLYLELNKYDYPMNTIAVSTFLIYVI